MPAWNPALPPEEIWKLVAYVESLGGAYPACAVRRRRCRATGSATTSRPRCKRTLSASTASLGPEAERRHRLDAERAKRGPTRAARRRPARSHDRVDPRRRRSRRSGRPRCSPPPSPSMSYLRTFGPAGDPATRLGWGLGIVSIVGHGRHHACCARRDRQARRAPASSTRELTVRRDEGGLSWIYIGVGISTRGPDRLRGLDDVHGRRGRDAARTPPT